MTPLISMVMPYWMRQEVTNKAIARMNEIYGNLNMEIVIADDGSPVPFIAPDSDIPIRVIRLPEKQDVKDPCVPLNAAAKAAQGELICLANPELIHNKPVIGEMLRRHSQLGANAIIMASVWCPEDSLWHVHPSIGGRTIHGITMPTWENSPFLALMTKKLWDASGGYDEDYRDGWGYCDHDWVLRADRLNPDVLVVGDLVVEHSRSGAKSAWTKEQNERNRELFIKKWHKNSAH